MAEIWSVTPSEGVINNNDGTFEFSANTTFCNKTYIIEYKDTGDGCACNAVFTQVGKDCSTTYDDPIWDVDPDSYCESHPGESTTINGHYWIHPRHVEGCSTCVDDPSYSASTSMTVSCPTPCDSPWAEGVGYSWCSESLTPGTCAKVGCGSGELSALQINSVSADEDWISGFEWGIDAGETWYTIRAKCKSMPCNGGQRCATLTINTNKGTFHPTTCQHGCIENCSKMNEGCCCTDTQTCP